MKKIKFKIIFFIRNLLFSFLATIDSIVFFNQDQLFVLCYHSINNGGWYFEVSKESLEKQLDYLTRNFQQISASELEKVILNGKKISGKKFIVTIDDGYSNVYNHRHIFESYGIKPIIFILSDSSKANRRELDNKLPFMNAKQIQELINLGWVIGSHGATHTDFANLNRSTERKEILDSKKILTARYKKSISYFAYPKGRFTDMVLLQVKKAGYKLAFTMENEIINPLSTAALQVPRIDINKSYKLNEFKSLLSPSVILAKKFVKQSIIGKIYN